MTIVLHPHTAHILASLLLEKFGYDNLSLTGILMDVNNGDMGLSRKAYEVLSHGSCEGVVMNESCEYFILRDEDEDFYEEDEDGKAIIVKGEEVTVFVNGKEEGKEEEEAMTYNMKATMDKINYHAGRLENDHVWQERFINGWAMAGGQVEDLEGPCPWCAPWCWDCTLDAVLDHGTPEEWGAYWWSKCKDEVEEMNKEDAYWGDM